MDIFELCLEWIPRGLNDKADYISRIRDFDICKVNPQIFSWIDSLWGPHSVNCFASIEYTQLSLFYSRFWCPGTAAVDAFTVNWNGEVNWWVPPIYLVSRTIRHAEACKSRGTLLLPSWKSAPFGPCCAPMVAIWHLLSSVCSFHLHPFSTWQEYKY